MLEPKCIRKMTYPETLKYYKKMRNELDQITDGSCINHVNGMYDAISILSKTLESFHSHSTAPEFDEENLISNVDKVITDPDSAILEYKKAIVGIQKLVQELVEITGDTSIRLIVDPIGRHQYVILASTVFKSDAFWCMHYETLEVTHMYYRSLHKHLSTKAQAKA